MLLQIAFDKPEHLALLPQIQPFADIVEVGTPLLKRFGVSAITTARELCRDVLVLADTKTVDAGQLEADMVFGAGAAFMTVLSCASAATHDAVGRRASAFGATVVVDTITESGKAELLPSDAVFPESFGYVALHSPTDARLAGDTSNAHIDAVRQMHARGFRVSLAGGIGPHTLDAVIAVKPEIVVVGSAITESPTPERQRNGSATDCPSPAVAGRGTGDSRASRPYRPRGVCTPGRRHSTTQVGVGSFRARADRGSLLRWRRCASCISAAWSTASGRRRPRQSAGATGSWSSQDRARLRLAWDLRGSQRLRAPSWLR